MPVGQRKLMLVPKTRRSEVESLSEEANTKVDKGDEAELQATWGDSTDRMDSRIRTEVLKGLEALNSIWLGCGPEGFPLPCSTQRSTVAVKFFNQPWNVEALLNSLQVKASPTLSRPPGELSTSN
ncbi:hypothetical protein SRHO_G00301740 [Serrasalmus rhombeus]